MNSVQFKLKQHTVVFVWAQVEGATVPEMKSSTNWTKFECTRFGTAENQDLCGLGMYS